MGLLTWFLNVNSIKAHISEILRFLKDDPSYHLFGVAERKLGLEVEDYFVRIIGSTLVQQDRKVKGGEVALYARSSLKVTIFKIRIQQALRIKKMESAKGLCI